VKNGKKTKNTAPEVFFLNLRKDMGIYKNTTLLHAVSKAK
jgi:hypothetical protein